MHKTDRAVGGENVHWPWFGYFANLRCWRAETILAHPAIAGKTGCIADFQVVAATGYAGYTPLVRCLSGFGPQQPGRDIEDMEDCGT